MNIFKKENLKETFTALYKRRLELSEASEWFDGSDGELEIIDECNMVSAAFDIFYKVHKVSATQYFRLDEVKISNVQFGLSPDNNELQEISFDIFGLDYETLISFDDSFSIRDGVILDPEGIVIPENTSMITALRSAIEENKEMFEKKVKARKISF